MATAEQGGPTTTTANNSSYGGGGAGGKFRKKPLRRQATPYDRPPTVQRASVAESNPNWLTKLVVDPASKLISYGANRFFGPLLRKRLPPPPTPPPQPPEANIDGGMQFEDAVQSQEAPPKELAIREFSQQEIEVRESSQLINNSSSNGGISDLAQLLKQKTFTRSEITHLTELLQSKVGELSHGVEREKETAFVDSPDEKRNEGIRSHAATPIFSSKVLEDDIGSPAELAKAYMGSRPSKLSPMLGMHSQVGRENSGLLSNIPFTSKSPIVPLTRRSSVSLGATENGFTTPRSRGRSAIYNMARTPYSRGHQTSIVRGGGNCSNDFGLPTPSQRLAISEHGEKLDKSTALKRRSSFLDDEVGSVGPIRRIRQKHNLLVPRVPHTALGSGIGSSKKHPLIGEASHELSKAIVRNENGNLASTSHTSVPSQSTEVASRILQHLEKLSPKEKLSESKLAAHKPSESKFVAAQEKCPFKLTSGVLRGQALRSMEDVGTSKLMLDVQDDHNREDRSNYNVPDAPESTSQKQEKVEATLHKEYAMSMKSNAPSIKISDSPVRNGASQPIQKKRAFRMSAQEDSFDQEDDVHHNNTALITSSDKKGPTEVPHKESNLSTAENTELVQTSSFSSKTSEFGGPGSSKVGESSIGLAFPVSEEAGKASQAALSPPSNSFDKPKDNPPPLFSFASKVGDKFPALPSESSGKMQEPKLDSASSLFSAATPNGSQSKTSESDNGILNVKKPAERNVEADSIFAASNGPFGSKPPGFSFSASSNNDKDQVSAKVSVFPTSSTSTADFASAGKSTTSTGSIFGSTAAPSPSAGLAFKFGPTDPSSSIRAASSANISEVADSKTNVGTIKNFGSLESTVPPFATVSSGSSKTNVGTVKSFGSLESTVPAFAAASSGSSTFGLAPPMGDHLHGSLFGGKFAPPGGETAPQGTSVQSISSASLPSFGTNSSTPFGSFSNSQTIEKSTFQLDSSSSSLDSIADTTVSEPPPTLAKFGSTSTTAAGSNTVAPNTITSPGVFTFGISSSTKTNKIGSSPAATSSPFVFGTSSSPAPAVNTTSSSFGTGASPFKFGGNSVSSSSAAVSSTTSSSVPNVFGSSFPTSPAPSFASPFTSTPSTGFQFGAMSTSGASSTPTGSTGPIFSFTNSTLPATFSTPNSGFGASPGNNDQMNAEDSMAEDPVQSSVPSFGQPAASQSAASLFGQPAASQSTTTLFGQPAASQSPAPMFGQPPAQSAVSQPPAPIFGQPAASPSPGFMFGQVAPPAQANPFQFGGLPSQPGSVNPNPFQASGSVEFNAGGSFSLGSGGGDKATRRRVNVSKNKNRKK